VTRRQLNEESPPDWEVSAISVDQREFVCAAARAAPSIQAPVPPGGLSAESGARYNTPCPRDKRCSRFGRT
jgi:hypothetical protein